MPPLSDNCRRNLNVLLVALLLVLVCVICIFSPTIVASISIKGPSVPVATFGPAKVSQVTTATNGELIGISDGTSVLDTRESNRKYKLDAADKLKAGDNVKASLLWEQAWQADSTDAETLIYLENQRVLDSHKPYITVVVATILSGPNSGVGSSNLQGAYVAQKEFNECSDAIQKENTHCSSLGPNWHVRLLIANSGSRKEDVAFVAQQIIQLSKTDKTFVGVMGWPLSDQTLQALDVLKTTNIPMVSSASSDALTGNVPHFFRISVPASKQAAMAADYAEQTLKAKKCMGLY